MIKVTGMNHVEYVLNADHIEKIEVVPESVITLINGKKYLVIDSLEDIVQKVIAYKNKIFRFDKDIYKTD